MKKHYSPSWFWTMASMAIVAATVHFVVDNWQAGLAWLLVLGGHFVGRVSDQLLDLKTENYALQETILELKETLIEEQRAYIARLENRLSR